MKSIMVADLKAGMIFDKAVYIEGNNILVPPGIPIKQRDIERLLSWGILEVFTDGDYISDGQVTEAILDNAEVYKNKSDDFSFYSEAVKSIEDVFHNITEDFVSGKDKEAIETVAETIFKHCKENGHILVQKILSTPLDQKNLTISSINCTILATIIGMVVFKKKPLLLDLILAALLHDVGMLKISDAILLKQDKLTVHDIQEIRAHAHKSFNIIKQLGFEERIAQIVLYHHEKWNGGGYPSRKKGAEIPLESRILAVADTYVALVNSRPYRNYLIGYNAMRAILSDNGNHFDPDVIKIFLKSVGIYPIGSIVKLSDQSIGKITDINSKAPLRPKLVLLRDSQGRKVDKEVSVDLMVKQDLFITKALDPKIMDDRNDQ